MEHSFEKDIVRYFREKSSLDEGWINGGYFVVEPNFIKLIKNDETLLEQEPFLKVTKVSKWLLLNILVFGNVWIL